MNAVYNDIHACIYLQAEDVKGNKINYCLKIMYYMVGFYLTVVLWGNYFVFHVIVSWYFSYWNTWAKLLMRHFVDRTSGIYLLVEWLPRSMMNWLGPFVDWSLCPMNKCHIGLLFDWSYGRINNCCPDSILNCSNKT